MKRRIEASRKKLRGIFDPNGEGTLFVFARLTSHQAARNATRVRVQFLAAGILLISACIFAAMSFYGVSIAFNRTGSQPNWLLLVLWGRPFRRGDLVAFRFPGSRYYREGILFAKQVQGMPGDDLEIRDDRTLWLNGALLDTVRAADSKGEPVAPFYYRGKIPDGSYFLYAAAPKSYDSRYFGLIGKERIVGKVIPLF